MTIDEEVSRLRKLFEGADENKLALLDGQIIENARLRVQLEELGKVVLQSGLIKVHPSNPTIQKETPVARLITKIRASYVNSLKLLCKELGVKEENFEDDLGEFE